MLHDASFAGSGVCFAERLCLAGNYRTTCGACVSECIDDAGEQYQLQGRSSLLRCAGLVGSYDRPERRGDSATAGIDCDHGEYLECRKFGGILLDVSADVDCAERSGNQWIEFDQRGRESEQHAANHGDRHGQEWNGPDRPQSGVRVDDADDDSRCSCRNGDPTLSRCSRDYGGLSATKLQSFAVQSDWAVRQRKAGDLEPGRRDRAGNQQHQPVHREHEFTLPAAGGLHADRDRLSCAAALPAELDGHQQRWQHDLHGQHI